MARRARHFKMPPGAAASATWVRWRVGDRRLRILLEVAEQPTRRDPRVTTVSSRAMSTVRLAASGLAALTGVGREAALRAVAERATSRPRSRGVA
jgi:hypothetical protein